MKIFHGHGYGQSSFNASLTAFMVSFEASYLCSAILNHHLLLLECQLVNLADSITVAIDRSQRELGISNSDGWLPLEVLEPIVHSQ
jgi:hypothetical protein